MAASLMDVSGRAGKLRELVSELKDWRPVRESNPCRRREREGNHCNSKELRDMETTLPPLENSRERLLDV